MGKLVITKQTNDPVAVRANTLHSFITQRGWEMVKAAMLCGKILEEKKARIGHGRWKRWVGENLDFSIETSQVYMRLHKHRDRLYEIEPDSLRVATAFIRGDNRITPGKLSGDEKILIRNIVTPIKLVRKRLKRLPCDPIHYETVMIIMDKLQEEIAKLVAEIS